MINFLPRFLWIILISLQLTSCCNKQRLFVHSQYITLERLASYHVNTPDPRKECPDIGQCLFISWVLPLSYLSYENLHLDIGIHYRNGTEEQITVPIDKTLGFYRFSLLNKDYVEKRGFLAYKVTLLGGNETLEEWVHQMWVETIHINDK